MLVASRGAMAVQPCGLGGMTAKKTELMAGRLREAWAVRRGAEKEKCMSVFIYTRRRAAATKPTAVVGPRPAHTNKKSCLGEAPKRTWTWPRHTALHAMAREEDREAEHCYLRMYVHGTAAASLARAPAVGCGQHWVAWPADWPSGTNRADRPLCDCQCWGGETADGDRISAWRCRSRTRKQPAAGTAGNAPPATCPPGRLDEGPCRPMKERGAAREGSAGMKRRGSISARQPVRPSAAAI